MNHDSDLPSMASPPTNRSGFVRTQVQGQQKPRPQEFEGSGSSFLGLPSELHLQLMSWLNFRDLQMLRATNSYFRYLPSDVEIARIRRDYVAELVRAEMEEVTESATNALSTFSSSNSSNDTKSPTPQRLTCYSCLHHLPIHSFSSTQTTRRRGKGHADASKRFCANCALRLHKWQPGITLSFPWGEAVYCRRCRELKPLRDGAAEWARIFGLCEGCRALLGIPAWHQHEGEGAQGFWYGAKELLDRTFAERGRGRERERGDMWEELREKIAELRLSEELEITSRMHKPDNDPFSNSPLPDAMERVAADDAWEGMAIAINVACSLRKIQSRKRRRTIGNRN
ncbi:hypothetical protein AJ78_05639 [Emergomyces pasteurianus Ep9510]|uniref:F-box domain-containing protein n=1 Tax=Emergomyces pasteurianus Ep9510 TaxID=1447872 RepID=A0A1J9Q1C3_9EURO|nr:hypothetical protein AJ78_05639 [Emergomyces pasteurianus Ep9510]